MRSVLLSAIPICTTLLTTGMATAAPISFNREIRPILSNHCYACHGPDERQRKAGLRLDIREVALGELDSGATPIVPGDPEASALVQRVTAGDPEDRMPPLSHDKPLSKEQIDTLRQWVEQGAPWEGHWAYLTPKRPELPVVEHPDWPRNPIDHFILAEQEKRGLEPSPEASRERLARRASLDLTGLPPTIEEIETFLADDSEQSYEALVDRLLDSRHYGERQAMFWLDLSRYGETQGFHHDRHRDMWHWRDWVIDAYNGNKPFDQFTIEQLAGDLLPEPTRDQLIATGFHRNEMTTSEGGALPEEYLVKYVVGRVDTTARVWLGSSLACAECHDHKYDPVTQEEYYRFFALFNNVPEDGLDRGINPRPRLSLETEEQAGRRQTLQQELTALEKAHASLRESPNPEYEKREREWIDGLHSELVDRWTPLRPLRAESEEGTELAFEEDATVVASGPLPDRETYTLEFHAEGGSVTGILLETLPDPRSGLLGRGEEGDFVLTGFEAEVRPGGGADPPSAPRIAGWRSIGPFGSGLEGEERLGTVFAPEADSDAAAFFGEERRRWSEPTDDPAGMVLQEPGVYYLAVRLETGDRTEGTLRLHTDRPLLARLGNETFAPAEQGAVDLRLQKGENRLLLKLDWETGGSLRPEWVAKPPRPVKFKAAVATHERDGHGAGGAIDGQTGTGWSGRRGKDRDGRPESLWFQPETPFEFEDGTVIRIRLAFLSPVPGSSLARFRLSTTDSSRMQEWVSLPGTVRSEILGSGSGTIDPVPAAIRNHYRESFVKEIRQLRALADAKRKEHNDLRNSIPHVMVMAEAEKRRDTHILIRGEYDNPGRKVEPGVPAALFSEGRMEGNDRLALARWLVHPDHPLTSRVIVNHYWQQFFGTGIVESSEDFGSQGSWPTHPDLLDWLAREFVESGWDIKHMHRLILTSATYRQDSRLAPDHPEVDPRNLLLTRFPRLRLEAEAIRDMAMAASGLLDRTIGGESIYPWQPPGLWEQLAFQGTRKWMQSEGSRNYRRGLYVYWRRSVPYPSFVTFDAPSRETCTIRRARTNTPLQALVLMNDPVYVEAARALGLRILREGGESLEDRIRHGWRLVLGRMPVEAELREMEQAWQDEFEHFRQHRSEANQLIHVGASEPPVEVDICRLAAWTVIGNILLNLDETITKG